MKRWVGPGRAGAPVKKLGRARSSWIDGVLLPTGLFLLSMSVLASTVVAARAPASAEPPEATAEAPAASVDPTVEHADHDQSDTRAASTNASADNHRGHTPVKVVDPSKDVLVDADTAPNGVRVLVGQADDGWSLHPIALIQPKGYGEEDWISELCVSGSGRYAAVAIAPRSASNDPSKLDRGAAAYSVDLATGEVTPLMDGVALYYHTPGCGADDRAAFSRFTKEGRSEVYVADLAAGTVRRELDSPGRLTSAVPTPDGLAFVSGSRVVRMAGGAVVEEEEHRGTPNRLVPTAEGGVYFQANVDETTATEVFELGRPDPIASGAPDKVRLHQGRGGRPNLTGADAPPSTDEVHVIDGALDTSGVLSLEGSVGVAPDPIARSADGLDRPSSVLVRKPDAAEPVVTPVPADDAGHPSTVLTTDVGPSAWVIAGAPEPPLANTASPTCAVPRNDVERQARQPSAEQIFWAIQRGVRGLLPNRPANYLGSSSTAYSPSVDFPLIPLAGNPNKVIPPEIVGAVMAQESAMSQASWRVVRGSAGNPLIANYYGTNADLSTLDYDNADCGYGLGQLTTWMKSTVVDPQVWTAEKQRRVAQDYAENVAATIWVLSTMWNQLYTYNKPAPLIANGGNSDSHEAWYMVLWMYNTGLKDATLLPPGSVIDGNNGDGLPPHGLGWTNNPQQGDYDPARLPFLRWTWTDSKHPNHWSYPERVLGFVENPKFDYTPWKLCEFSCVVDYPPRNTFCSPSVNQCDPNEPHSSSAYCNRMNDRMCWWYLAVSFPTPTPHPNYYPSIGSDTAPEPPWPDRYYPNCSLQSLSSENDPPASAVIVDNQPNKVTLRTGCNNSGWGNQGTFQVVYGQDSGGVPVGVIDWHQLGSGWGGHVWFTKNRATNTVPNDISHTNKGIWTPPASVNNTTAEIRVHIPDNGASTENAKYKVVWGAGANDFDLVPVNQHLHKNQWVKLGTYALGAAPRVELTNFTSEETYTRNVAYDAIAFIPQVAGACPAPPTPASDSDGDRIPNATETANGLNPNAADSDGDGIPDGWEADPAMEGAGVYLPGHACRVATRDELFGPYNTRSQVTDVGELIGSDTRFNAPPSPRHKDVFLELDWQSCNQDNSGCPIITLPFGNVPVNRFMDPAYHLPPRAAIEDVVVMFRNSGVGGNPDGINGVNLHVIVDEKTDHHLSCDVAPSDAKGKWFGSPAQRSNRELMTAKSMAFRYLWSGHSTARAGGCVAPPAADLIFHRPVPDYDYTPYGSTNKPGNDILLSLSLGWWCPSDVRIVSPEAVVWKEIFSLDWNDVDWTQSPCIRSWEVPGQPFGSTVGDGLYPNATFTQTVGGTTTYPVFAWPMTRLLGESEADGARHLFGRSIARLLGMAMGISPSASRNDPLARKANPAAAALRVEGYQSWTGARFAPVREVIPGGPAGPASEVGLVTAVGTDVKFPTNLANQALDLDGDGTIEAQDNCPGVANPGQANGDWDVLGDACDADGDGDGQWDALIDDGWTNNHGPNDQSPGDRDNDSQANGSDTDDDGDFVPDFFDSCPLIQSGAENFDGDTLGDMCDPDDDNDGIVDDQESLFGSDPKNASKKPEATLFTSPTPRCADGFDNDLDGFADGLDNGCTDYDGDTMPDVADPCPGIQDYGWRDRNFDHWGDACVGVKIRRVDIPGIANYALSQVPSVTWASAQSGAAQVRVGGTDCSTGTVAANVNVVATIDEDHSDGQFITVKTDLSGVPIPTGNVTVRVCVTDGGGTVRSDQITVRSEPNYVSPTKSSYFPLSPQRLLHTGENIGLSGAFQAGQTRDLVVAGRGGVPASGATAVAVNITVAQATQSSHMTVWPQGEPLPNASNINFGPGNALANSAVVKLGPTGQISIRNNSGSVTVIIDVVGWFDAGTAPTPLLFNPMTPTRLLDSRDGTGGYSTPWPTGGTPRTVPVRNVFNVPVSAQAVVLALTIVNPTASSHLTVFPSGEAQPQTSVINFQANQNLAANVVAKIGTDGKIAIFNNAGTVNVIADVVGYYSTAAGGRWFKAITPVRAVDSRFGVGVTQAPLAGGVARQAQIAHVSPIPGEAKAIVATVTVVGATQTSHLIVWANGSPQPTASMLAISPNVVLANLVFSGLGSDGKLSIYNNSGSVDVILDIVGWYE